MLVNSNSIPEYSCPAVLSVIILTPQPSSIVSSHVISLVGVDKLLHV